MYSFGVRTVHKQIELLLALETKLFATKLCNNLPSQTISRSHLWFVSALVCNSDRLTRS